MATQSPWAPMVVWEFANSNFLSTKFPSDDLKRNVLNTRITVGLLFVAAGVWLIWSTRPPGVQVAMREMHVADLTRKFRVVKTTALEPNSQPPLVIALHGALDTTEQMAESTQLDKLCASKGFVLVYLEGRNLNWPPFIPDDFPDIYEPDLAFFDAVCDQMEKEGIDPGRIYLVGVSQGGCMANVVAMKRSERLAAAVVNCGWVPKPLESLPPATPHKCPMLFIVGSEDTQVDAKTVRVGYELFKMAGHPVRFEVLRGAGHGWNAAYGVNDMVWKFLSDKENH